MTTGEIALARSVFGDEIKYEQVKIFNEKWAFFQPRDRAMAPNGNIYFAPGNPGYVADFSAADIHGQAIFIHELTHVWQHQHGVDVIVRGAINRNYDYLPLSIDSKFDDFGIEQQAQIIRDYFYLTKQFYGKGWPPLAVYLRVIPFLH
jgi:hypothetical protein